jgi:hypothetical protein
MATICLISHALILSLTLRVLQDHSLSSLLRPISSSQVLWEELKKALLESGAGAMAYPPFNLLSALFAVEF